MKKILTISLLSSVIVVPSFSVIACDNLNLANNKITNFDPLLNSSQYLYNDNDNFTLIMENDNFNTLVNAMKTNNKTGTNNTENTFNNFFKNEKVKPNLDDATWNKIYSSFLAANKGVNVSDGYIGLIEINNGKFIYGNSTADGHTNIKTINDKPKLKINELITTALPKETNDNTVKILSNENMITALNNQYLNGKWETDSITKMLQANNFQYTDNNVNDVASAIYNWFQNNYDNVKTYLNKPDLNNGTIINLN